MSNAVMPLSDYKNTCNKIREKTASTDNIKSGELADKVAEVYEKGKQAEYDRFWDSFQKNGTQQKYQFAFGSTAWNDENFKPKYDLDKVDNLYFSFRQTGIVNLEECINKAGIKWDTSKVRAGYLGYTFAECEYLQVLPEITVIEGGRLGWTFYGSRALVTIRKIKLLSDDCTFVDTFTNCIALENIVFEGVISNDIAFTKSTKLTKASIENIFSCLSDTTSGSTLTISKTAVNNAFETSEETADGSTGTEWLNLVATKPNWTISLST